jgi:DNA-directed RNA polymerase III subunit RPC7
MSGRRGRGRGRSVPSTQLELLGNPADIAAPLLQPPPIFPPLNRKPLPLDEGVYYQELLVRKQNLRMSLNESLASILTSSSNENDIARYSDRYATKISPGNVHVAILEGIPHWRARLPKELHPKRKKTKMTKEKRKTLKNSGKKELIDLDKLEEKVKDEGEDGEGDEENEEEYDEEIEEEEGDYQLTYFDPGDDDLELDDDDKAEPYY